MFFILFLHNFRGFPGSGGYLEFFQGSPGVSQIFPGFPGVLRTLISYNKKVENFEDWPIVHFDFFTKTEFLTQKQLKMSRKMHHPVLYVSVIHICRFPVNLKAVSTRKHQILKFSTFFHKNQLFTTKTKWRWAKWWAFLSPTCPSCIFGSSLWVWMLSMGRNINFKNVKVLSPKKTVFHPKFLSHQR